MCPIRKIYLTALITAFSWLPMSASATIIVSLDSITEWDPVFNPGEYDWSFSARISDDDGLLDNGDVYFTIYDLPGSIVTVESPNDWQASSQLVGRTPGLLMPTDNGTIANVTFELACFPSACNYPGSNTPLTEGFIIRLDTNVAEFSQYAWQDYDKYPQFPDGEAPAALQNGLGTVVDGRVPEPTSLALMALGLAGIGYSRRKKI